MTETSGTQTDQERETEVKRCPGNQILAFPKCIFSPGIVPMGAWPLTPTELVVALLRVQLLDVLKVLRHGGPGAGAGPGLPSRLLSGLGLSSGLVLLLKCWFRWRLRIGLGAGSGQVEETAWIEFEVGGEFGPEIQSGPFPSLVIH